MEFFSHQTNFPFMATRKVWYTLSAVLMIVSLVSLFTRGLNLGIDFTGGVSAEVSFSRATDVDACARSSRGGFKRSAGAELWLIARHRDPPATRCQAECHRGPRAP